MCQDTLPPAPTKICRRCDGWAGARYDRERRGRRGCRCPRRRPEHAAYRCGFCGDWKPEHAEMRSRYRGAVCECHAPFTLTETPRDRRRDKTNHGSPAACPCGWRGFSHRRTHKGTHRVVACPGCGLPLVRLTPEQVAVVERSSGRPIHDNEAVVRAVLARRFRGVPAWVRERLYDAGMERLVHCMICYDPADAAGANFCTYAMRCVRLYMLRAYNGLHREAERDAERFREYAELTLLYRPEMVERTRSRFAD